MDCVLNVTRSARQDLATLLKLGAGLMLSSAAVAQSSSTHELQVRWERVNGQAFIKAHWQTKLFALPNGGTRAVFPDSSLVVLDYDAHGQELKERRADLSKVSNFAIELGPGRTALIGESPVTGEGCKIKVIDANQQELITHSIQLDSSEQRPCTAFALSNHRIGLSSSYSRVRVLSADGSQILTHDLHPPAGWAPRLFRSDGNSILLAATRSDPLNPTQDMLWLGAHNSDTGALIWQRQWFLSARFERLSIAPYPGGAGYALQDETAIRLTRIRNDGSIASDTSAPVPFNTTTDEIESHVAGGQANFIGLVRRVAGVFDTTSGNQLVDFAVPGKTGNLQINEIGELLLTSSNCEMPQTNCRAELQTRRFDGQLTSQLPLAGRFHNYAILSQGARTFTLGTISNDGHAQISIAEAKQELMSAKILAESRLANFYPMQPLVRHGNDAYPIFFFADQVLRRFDASGRQVFSLPGYSAVDASSSGVWATVDGLHAICFVTKSGKINSTIALPGLYFESLIAQNGYAWVATRSATELFVLKIAEDGAVLENHRSPLELPQPRIKLIGNEGDHWLLSNGSSLNSRRDKMGAVLHAGGFGLYMPTFAANGDLVTFANGNYTLLRSFGRDGQELWRTTLPQISEVVESAWGVAHDQNELLFVRRYGNINSRIDILRVNPETGAILSQHNIANTYSLNIYGAQRHNNGEVAMVGFVDDEYSLLTFAGPQLSRVYRSLGYGEGIRWHTGGDRVHDVSVRNMDGVGRVAFASTALHSDSFE